MVSAVAVKKHLGRYELVRHLATGGMADVLVARATGIEGFERHVVLKRIRAEQARDTRFVQMFLDEARLAASLHHANIVQVHDIGQDDGEYFFAMEYVHGEDLRKLLMHVADRDQRVPLEHVITIVSTVAAALHHAHEHRGPDRKPLEVVHRDVSPANILVGYDGTIKVVDFGIAKATHHNTTETHSGLLKGKVAYMSPEQCVGGAVDRRSDIFCLGIVLYELATVRRLFKGANDFMTMSAITQGAIPPPRSERPDISLELEQIILKALSRDPADRYQTADDMRQALDAFAEHAKLRTSGTALADYMRGLFGNPPAPWLIDDEEPEVELSYDFDGSATGMAQPPVDLDIAAAAEHSPIRRARTKAITEDHSAAVAAVTQHGAARSSAIRWIIAGAGGALALAIILVAAMRSGDPSADPPPAAAQFPATAAPVPRPPPAPPEHSAPPPSSPSPIESSQPNGAAKALTVTRDAGKPVAPPPQKMKPFKTTKPPAPGQGKWDPNSLFPKKH